MMAKKIRTLYGRKYSIQRLKSIQLFIDGFGKLCCVFEADMQTQPSWVVGFVGNAGSP
jgi:hypothetical protein